MIYTLEQLSNGEVACINDGTPEQLEAVLKHTFNGNYESRSAFGGSITKYFYKKDMDSRKLNLPVQSVKEFYKQLQFQDTMNKQYLTRKQLIELHKVDSCEEWKMTIAEILEENLLSLNDDKIQIYSKYINSANQKCTTKQKQLLKAVGLVLSNEIAVCDSKDGDCIKISDTEYWINREGFKTLIRLNSKNEYVVRTTLQSVCSDIKGTLVKEPLSLQIKIN